MNIEKATKENGNLPIYSVIARFIKRSTFNRTILELKHKYDTTNDFRSGYKNHAGAL